MNKKFRLALFVYSLVCDIPVSFLLCLASAITAQSNFDSGNLTINIDAINWGSVGINFAIALSLSLMISNFIPLTAIGRWFTGLFKVPNETYTGNIRYRLLATLITSLIFFGIISPSLTIFNCYIYPLIIGEPVLSFKQALFSFLINAPILIIVGFISSLINDIIAYKAAHKIDNTF